MSTPSKPETRTISVDYLARVEGEGNLKVRVRDGQVEIVEFGIFEPPRFYEAFLRGRRFGDAPDITARICGICPIAYQMSAVHAMEDIFGVKMEGALRELRRLIYCGEWIESHVLHAFMLHLPDFLGYQSAIHMAADHRDAVEKALKLKKIGNDIVNLLGGREIHPINVKVGGFYKVPTKRQLQEMVPNLEWALDAATWAVEFTGRPALPRDRTGLRVRVGVPPRRIPLQRGEAGVQQGHRRARVRVEPGVRRGPRRPLQRPAVEGSRAGLLPRGAAGPLQPELREAEPAGAAGGGGRRPGADLLQPLQEHRGALPGDAARRRGGLAHHRRPTRCRPVPTCRWW